MVLDADAITCKFFVEDRVENITIDEDRDKVENLTQMAAWRGSLPLLVLTLKNLSAALLPFLSMSFTNLSMTSLSRKLCQRIPGILVIMAILPRTKGSQM